VARPPVGPLPADPLGDGSGSGGAARPPPLPTPAPGHCLVLVWVSAAPPAVVPSPAVVPVAGTPPDAASAAAPLAPPTPASAARRAQREARAAPTFGATTPAAWLVTRRKPKVDSRRLT
jgi:hypothetical protein